MLEINTKCFFSIDTPPGVELQSQGLAYLFSLSTDVWYKIGTALGLDADHRAMLMSLQELPVSRRVLFVLWLKFVERLPSRLVLFKALSRPGISLQQLQQELGMQYTIQAI